jgi:hypothetical protein
MTYEVGMIAHSCGVSHFRDLERSHARIVKDNGMSVPLDELYFTPKAGFDEERRDWKSRPWSSNEYAALDKDISIPVVVEDKIISQHQNK